MAFWAPSQRAIKFICDTARTGAILDERPETAAVEMEGAAVAQVCADYRVSFCCHSNDIQIKRSSISD